MPKDYAKNKKPRKNSGASRQSRNQSTPLVLWFLAFLLVAAFIGALVYLKWYQTDSPNRPEVTTSTQAKEQISEKNSGSKKESVAKSEIVKTTKPVQTKTINKAEKVIDNDQEIPLYDLHEDLTNKEVIISQDDLSLPDNVNKYTYSMPCGSFRENYRAEELKAQIAMTGNNSTTAQVKYKQETQNPVVLGPFNKKRTAESVRHRLQDNNINGCIITPHLIK